MRKRAYKDIVKGLKTRLVILHNLMQMQQYQTDNALLYYMRNPKKKSFQLLENILSKVFVEAVQVKIQGLYL